MNQSLTNLGQQPVAKVNDAEMLEEELIELQVNSAAHAMFQAMTWLQFWTKQLVAYPSLAKAALHSIILFPTTYLYESAFSALVHIKTKKRIRLDPSCQMCFSYLKSSRE